MPTELLINWLMYGCVFPLLSPLLVGIGMRCLRHPLVSAFGRLFCDGQLCFYASGLAASAAGELITKLKTGQYAQDSWVLYYIVALVFIFFITTFFFAVLTFAERGNLNEPPAIWISVCLAIGSTVVAGAIRWQYHLY